MPVTIAAVKKTQHMLVFLAESDLTETLVR